MKTIVFVVCMMMTFITCAEIVSVGGYSNKAVFRQFTHDEFTNTGDYTDGRNSSQNWLGAQTIKLTVGNEMDVWLSNYVASWYEPVLPLDGNVYDMGNMKYGAYEVNGSKSWIGNGETTTVEYGDGAGHSNDTTAYFLGHFEGGEEVYLWLTTLPADDHEAVSTEQLVYDGVDTILASRVDGTHDIADNVRINFGLTNGYSREWVAFGVSDENSAVVPSGGPLPGLMTVSILAFGTVLGASRLGKKKQIKA